MAKTEVSIILPNFNSSEFLEKTLNSVLNQTYKHWRLIIVDDCSNLKTIQILKKYEFHKKIKIYYLKKNMGAGFCRNYAIDKARSEYLAFIDSDDLWLKSKLSEQIEFMKRKKINFSYTFYIANKNNRKKKVKTPKVFDYESFINNTSICTSTMIIKKKICKNIKFLNINICEDYFYKCLLLKKNKYAYCLDKYLTQYRIRKDSLQSNKLKNIYWVWKINSKNNKLNFIRNLISILFISINSIKKYGFK
jgi:teichuronic acid biosynthesis glycosyltransferase TuaG